MQAYDTHIVKGPRLLIERQLAHVLFYNEHADTDIYTLSLHDALPISLIEKRTRSASSTARPRSGPSTSKTDRKSTRLNSSHRTTSYAVFCLKIKSIQLKLAPFGGGAKAQR